MCAQMESSVILKRYVGGEEGWLLEGGGVLSSGVVVNEHGRYLSGDEIVPLTGELLNGSWLRKGGVFVGILQLTKCTYGVHPGANGKPYYRAVPYNRDYPNFLVPHKNTRKAGMLTNVFKNKYVMLQFTNTYSESGLPIAFKMQEIGDVDDLRAYDEYVLRGLCVWRPPSKREERKVLSLPPPINISKLGETVSYVYTVDGEGTNDRDDGFSVSGDGKLTIYITDVLAQLTDEEMKYLSGCVSSIYMSNVYQPMLPPWLSKSRLSLDEGTSHSCMVIRVGDNPEISFEKNVYIHRNYTYDSFEKSAQCDALRYLTVRHSSILEEAWTPRKMVEYWMRYVNMAVIEYIRGHSDGEYIYRTRTCVNDVEERYVRYRRSSEVLDYIHITSPIRRIVDLWNMGMLSKSELSEAKREWLCRFMNEEWDDGEKSRQISRVEQNSMWLKVLTERPTTDMIVGVVEEIDEGDMLIWIPRYRKYKWTPYVEGMKEKSMVGVRLFLFLEEETYERKVKMMVSSLNEDICM